MSEGASASAALRAAAAAAVAAAANGAVVPVAEADLGTSAPPAVTEGNKNARVVKCVHGCRSKILNPGVAQLVKRKCALPAASGPADGAVEEQEYDCWLVTSMMEFENVGFSRTVGSTIKYLTCADCDRGPIGWHDTAEKAEFFVVHERVAYVS